MNRDRWILAAGVVLIIAVMVTVELRAARGIVDKISDLITEPRPPAPTPEETGAVVRRAEEITRGDR